MTTSIFKKGSILLVGALFSFSSLSFASTMNEAHPANNMTAADTTEDNTEQNHDHMCKKFTGQCRKNDGEMCQTLEGWNKCKTACENYPEFQDSHCVKNAHAKGWN